MNILVVDDKPAMARVTALALESLGCRAFTAPTRAAAGRILATERIDLLFLDVNLGGECGFELLAELRAAPVAPPVVMFTAHERDEIHDEARRRGALDCLVKPFTLDDLRRQLDRVEKRSPETVRRKKAP
jgi:two-component system response regulator (stage 0 sporulation protein F)